MNMLPFEYILARNDAPGCLILSEFSGCSRVLNGALRVNPFRTEDVAIAIEEGLSMSIAEKTARRYRDLDFIENHDIYSWSKRIINDIVDAHNSENESLVRYGFGFGIGRTGLGKKQDSDLEELDIVNLCQDYKEAKRRIFFLDYSGTLVETSSMNMYLKKGGTARSWHYSNGGSRRPGGCLETRDPISDSVRSSLIELSRDSLNHVFVISTDLRDELEHALEGIPNLGLIAENGYVYKLSPEDEWQPVVEDSGNGAWYGGSASVPDSMPDSLDDPYGGVGVDPGDPKLHGWQDVVVNVIMPYTGRTNGSFCWRAPSAVSFNFVLADPELGYLQADNLFLELEYVLAGMPLTVEKGKGFVTVRLAGVTRGAAVAAILKSINRKANLGTDGNKNKVDFIVAFGDDIEDETVFNAVKKYKDSVLPAKKFATRVGWTSKKTRAEYYVDNAGDVGDALHDIIVSTEDVSNKFRRSVSMNRLSSHFVTKESLMSNADKNESSFRQRAPIVPQEPKHMLDQNASKFVQQVEARSEGLKNMSAQSRSATISSFRTNGQSKSRRKENSKPRLGSDGSTVGEKKRSVLPHSPSYIASPEEAAAMFAGQPTPEEAAFQAANKCSPSAADGETRDYLRRQGSLTRLNETEFDASIRDPRQIPPTVGDSDAAEGAPRLLNPEINRESTEIDPEHIDNAEMYVSGMLATESGPDLKKQISFVDVDELGKREAAGGGLFDKQTIQMVLSGVFGAGLMFILLNTGKETQTSSSPSRGPKSV
uniref:Uncharacterized protein n=1 Tax=Aplanochytrium stocchinoi TaxID=215587 RepID=A0A6S8DJN0_9STRA